MEIYSARDPLLLTNMLTFLFFFIDSCVYFTDSAFS